MSASLPLSDMPAPPSGRFVDGVHYFPVHVYFEDTDTGGVVYHANYLRYMERARSDMLRLLGIDQRAALEAGEGVYAVTNAQIAYRAPARLDDDLMVVSRVAGMTGATVTIVQDMVRTRDGHGAARNNAQTTDFALENSHPAADPAPYAAVPLTRGEVSVAFLSPQGRPKRQPKAWVALFTRIAQGEDLNP